MNIARHTNHLLKGIRFRALAACVVMAIAVRSQGQQPELTHRFESNVLAYEAADKTNAPPKGAILLAGDSQFFRWKSKSESNRVRILSYPQASRRKFGPLAASAAKNNSAPKGMH